MSNQQLLVLADDFSGACEMAGIALRYGRRVELQLDFDPASEAEVIVYDSDTRRLSGPEAGAKVHRFARAVLDSGKDFSLFRKIDSVLRGHVIGEAEILRLVLGKKQVFILSANPSKKRIIVRERYLIDGSPIDETDFRNDPDFPRLSPAIPDLLDRKGQHRHLTVSEPARLPGVFTCDLPDLAALDCRVVVREDRLYCGAADAFEIFLRKSIGTAALAPPDRGEKIEAKADLFLLVNGSTHRVVNEALVDGYDGIIRAILPADLIRMEDPLADSKFDRWVASLNVTWQENRMLFMCTPAELLDGGAASGRTVDLLAGAVHKLLRRNPGKRIHVFATGGATASAIIRLIDRHGLTVVSELAPGVVTIADTKKRYFTAKPGSYPWPKVVFRV